MSAVNLVVDIGAAALPGVGEAIDGGMSGCVAIYNSTTADAL